jgi:ABC-type dipeptide/oligopeptide/nickel transport system ATPase component
MSKIELKELDLDLIRPNNESVKTTAGGSKITIIGKPGSGKSVLIKAILASKKHLIPVGTVISGSEEINKFYARLFPNLFIYEKFRLSIIESVQKRQKLAKENLPVSWAVLVMDDCMEDVKIFNDPIMIGLMKNSRHWNLLSIFANQYVFDFKPVIRTLIDGVFIFREPNQSNREKIYKNFASIIPTYKLFCQIMDEITVDNTCIYIDNQTTSNDWKDCVYWYKAPLFPDFSFGCEEYWQFSEDRQK